MSCYQWKSSVIWAVFIHSLCCVVDVSSLPVWKTQLTHHRDWRGHYVFNGTSHRCTLYVHSVQYDDDGGAMVSFSAGQAKLDMTVFSQKDISIVFRKVATYHPGNHFYDDFEFVAEMVQYGSSYVLLGNITQPAANFSSIRLQPEGLGVTNHVKSSSLSVGLAVGICLSLFVVCVVIGVVILRWAIRKGYLRHVARSYKNFRNPDTRHDAGETETRDAPVSFSSGQRDGQGEEVNVHI